MADSPLAAGAVALRRFWRPFALIQGAAVVLTLAYHASAPVRAACAVAAGWKARGGWPFAAAAGVVAGVLLPEVAKLAVDRDRAALRGRAGALVFLVVLFAFNGVVVDWLYSFEARLFGAGGGAATVAWKVAFDQLLFTPLWLMLVVTLFLWRRRGFSVSATVPALRGGFFRQRVVPLLLPDWCFWIPMVSIIYAFPVPLQFVLFTLGLAAWSLIMVFIADASSE